MYRKLIEFIRHEADGSKAVVVPIIMTLFLVTCFILIVGGLLVALYVQLLLQGWIGWIIALLSIAVMWGLAKIYRDATK